MCTESSEQKNVMLDRVLAERRSYRMFGPEFPPEDEIRRIIHAGLLAPFAAAAVGNATDYFRRFFVMKKGSQSLHAAAPLVMAEIHRMSESLHEEMKNNLRLREHAMGFAQRLAMIKKRGVVPGIGTAPYYVVVAERKGYPPVEMQSLAHCMENMWLKATALDLGFQLVSITSEMAQNPEFCNLLGIAPGEWALMGCAIGYPQEKLSPSIRPPSENVTRWLE
jgi:nitroreductase